MLDSSKAVTDSVARNPESCPYRRRVDGDSQSRCICGLVAKVIGSIDVKPFCVEPAVCEACCRYPLPSGPRLNPVVASQVYRFSDELQKSMPRPATQQTGIHQSQVFATRWLAAVDRDGNRILDRGNDSPLGKSSRSSDTNDALQIGLVGEHTGFGLAHQNRDIAVQLNVDRWLVPAQIESPPSVPCRIDEMSRPLSTLEMEAWLDGLNLVLFAERPVFSNVTRVARRLGVRVVCIPNWEWLHPGMDWLRDVDLMLCPTQHTAQVLSNWKQRFDFEWKVDCVPWPVDTERFQFRLRRTCQRFVYVDGSGGSQAKTLDGPPNVIRRKGLDVLVAAARMAPEIPLTVFTNRHDVPAPPSNIQWRPLPPDNRLLYCDGDVCIQPSHWEGIGLPLLECQAAGMPLITTDASPMSEYQPLARIPATAQTMQLTSEIWIPAARIEPTDLANAMRSLHGRRISSHSQRARRFVERHHSWKVATPQIRERLQTCLTTWQKFESQPATTTRNRVHAS